MNEYDNAETSVDKFLKANGEVSQLDGTIVEDATKYNQQKYDAAVPFPDKFLKADGSIQDINGNVVEESTEYNQEKYNQAVPFHAKFLKADGTITDELGTSANLKVKLFAFESANTICYTDKETPEVGDILMTDNEFGVYWDFLGYLGDGAGGGIYANKYKCQELAMSRAVVNIQNKDGRPGIYISLPSVILNCDITDDDFGYEIEGAGIWVFIDSFTKRETRFHIYSGDSSDPEIDTYTVFYADGEFELNPENLNDVWTITSVNSDTIKAINRKLNVNELSFARNSERDYEENITSINAIESSSGLKGALKGTAVKIMDAGSDFTLYAWRLSIASGVYGYTLHEQVQVGDAFYLPANTSVGKIRSTTQLTKVFSVSAVTDEDTIKVNEGDAGDIIFIRESTANYTEKVSEVSGVLEISDNGLHSPDREIGIKMVNVKVTKKLYAWTTNSPIYIYTDKENPSVGDRAYRINTSGVTLLVKETITGFSGSDIVISGSNLTWRRSTSDYNDIEI